MTQSASSYRLSVAGGLRVVTGPLALVAANVAALVARGYRVWVRDPRDSVLAIDTEDGQLHVIFHPSRDASAMAPPWVDRLSDLMAEISNEPTNPERSNTP